MTGENELLDRAANQIRLGKQTGADGGGSSPHNIYVIAKELLDRAESRPSPVVGEGAAKTVGEQMVCGNDWQRRMLAAPSTIQTGDGVREAVARLEEIAGWFADDSVDHMLAASVAKEHSADLRTILAALASPPGTDSGSLPAQAPSVPTEGQEAVVVGLQERIHEVVDEGDGCWVACSGCQESVDGYVSTKDYPFSKVFRCQPGGGCSECGGLGVKWDDTDYDAMTASILADMAAEEAAVSTAEQVGTQSPLGDGVDPENPGASQ